MNKVNAEFEMWTFKDRWKGDFDRATTLGAGVLIDLQIPQTVGEGLNRLFLCRQ